MNKGVWKGWGVQREELTTSDADRNKAGLAQKPHAEQANGDGRVDRFLAFWAKIKCR